MKAIAIIVSHRKLVNTTEFVVAHTVQPFGASRVLAVPCLPTGAAQVGVVQVGVTGGCWQCRVAPSSASLGSLGQMCYVGCSMELALWILKFCKPLGMSIRLRKSVRPKSYGGMFKLTYQYLYQYNPLSPLPMNLPTLDCTSHRN
jgi:hypothetical protein